jgi:hypothetical protein
MIFRQVDEILNGRKTQTRRIVKPEHFGNRWYLNGYDDERINEVTINGRSLWVVGKTYAIVPKRGAKAVGRIRINFIRGELLQLISEDDAKAEGVNSVLEYCELWQSINGKKGTRWEDNPLVWVIGFELVKGDE